MFRLRSFLGLVNLSSTFMVLLVHPKFLCLCVLLYLYQHFRIRTHTFIYVSWDSLFSWVFVTAGALLRWGSRVETYGPTCFSFIPKDFLTSGLSSFRTSSLSSSVRIFGMTQSFIFLRVTYCSCKGSSVAPPRECWVPVKVVVLTSKFMSDRLFSLQVRRCDYNESIL